MNAERRNSIGPENPVLVGRITTVYGVKGWVKVHSYTEPAGNIWGYQPWWLRQDGAWQRVECDQHLGGHSSASEGSKGDSAKRPSLKSRKGNKALAGHLLGVDDRELAKQYCQRDIYISGGQLATLSEGEFYWHQLTGFSVYSVYPDRQATVVRLGVVKSLLETGANDVLVVVGDGESMDQRERLIPYIDSVILSVDSESGRIDVDWDPEF